MDHLEIPAQFSRPRIERHERIAEQVGALAVRSIKIVRSGTYRQKDQPALQVNAHRGPDVGSGAVLPIVTLPTLMPLLAGPRDGVERPCQFPGPDVECPHAPA